MLVLYRSIGLPIDRARSRRFHNIGIGQENIGTCGVVVVSFLLLLATLLSPSCTSLSGAAQEQIYKLSARWERTWDFYEGKKLCEPADLRLWRKSLS